MSNSRNGSVFLEPLPEVALTAEEAKQHMEALEEVIAPETWDKRASVTVRCHRNSVMTAEYAEEIFTLISDRGIPTVRVIAPGPVAAARFTEAATRAGRPESLRLYASDGVRASRKASASLGQYLQDIGC